MKITGATPPPDFPNLVVIEQDRDFSARHPEAAFWLRLKGTRSSIQAHPPCPRSGASAGILADNWTLPGDGRAYRYA